MEDNKTAHFSSDYDSNIYHTIPYYESFHKENNKFYFIIESKY